MEINSVEILGIIGAVIILISMAIPSTHRRQNIVMRCINIIGSLVIIVYSLKLAQPALANVFLNIAVCVVNIYYIIKLIISIVVDNHNKLNDMSSRDEDVK